MQIFWIILDYLRKKYKTELFSRLKIKWGSSYALSVYKKKV